MILKPRSTRVSWNLVNRKKQKKIHKEIKEIKNSIQELSKTMNKIQELLLTKTDLMYFSSKEKETQWKKEDEMKTCCFESEGAGGNNYQTIFVKGFENLRPRHEIKNALSKIFSRCGQVVRVFVPYECKTRVPLGFAFVNLKNGKGVEKALELNGTLMGGKELEVAMAWRRSEYNGYTDFTGCKDCFNHIAHLYTEAGHGAGVFGHG